MSLSLVSPNGAPFNQRRELERLAVAMVGAQTVLTELSDHLGTMQLTVEALIETVRREIAPSTSPLGFMNEVLQTRNEMTAFNCVANGLRWHGVAMQQAGLLA